jgi:hypothetical protein
MISKLCFSVYCILICTCRYGWILISCTLWPKGVVCYICTTYTNFWSIICPNNTTFKNISVTTFVAEIGVPREIHRPVASHWQTLSQNVLSSTPRHEWAVWWQKKGYCFDMPNVVSAIDGTSHEIQIRSNEPQQKHTFCKPIIFIDWYEKKVYKQW